MLPKVKKHLEGTKNPEYHFKMTRHFRGPEEAVHWAIKNWIEARYNPECFDPVDYMDPECPLLVRLANQGFRIARIHPNHPLWEYLDDKSQEYERNNRSKNYLIWKGDPRKAKEVIVTHFGPFSDREKIEGFHEDLSGFGDECMEALNSFGVFTIGDFHRMDQSQADQICNAFWNFLSPRIHLRLRDINREYSSLEAQMKTLSDKIEGGVGMRILGVGSFHLMAPLLKILEEKLAKMVAKALAKRGAKAGGAKVAAKKVPFAGAVVGLGFGIARLCQGKPGTALLEVASGAASCIPGGGTAASVALDATILAADCYDIKESVEVNII